MTGSDVRVEVRGKGVERLFREIAGLRLGRTGRVAALVETPGPHRHVERDRVEVLVGRGFAGDHPRKSFYRGRLQAGREVSAVALEVLRLFRVAPDVTGDNLVTEGIDLAALAEGDAVHAGEVVLERSPRDHRPCTTFRDRTSPEAFAAAGRGHRGALFVVRRGGTLRRGDPLRVVPRK